MRQENFQWTMSSLGEGKRISLLKREQNGKGKNEKPWQVNMEADWREGGPSKWKMNKREICLALLVFWIQSRHAPFTSRDLLWIMWSLEVMWPFMIMLLKIEFVAAKRLQMPWICNRLGKEAWDNDNKMVGYLQNVDHIVGCWLKGCWITLSEFGVVW